MVTGVEAVQEGVQRVVQEQGPGFLMNLLTSPIRLITGFFGGLINGGMWGGLGLFGLFNWAPDFARDMARTVSGWLGQQEWGRGLVAPLNQWIADMTNPNTPWTQRLFGSALAGAGAGGVANGLWESIGGLFGLTGNNQQRSPQQAESGGFGMGGILMTAAVVGIGAVLISQNVGGATNASQPEGAPGDTTTRPPRVPADVRMPNG